MVTGPAPALSIVDYYLTPVLLEELLPINLGVMSAKQETMISALGSPQLPLTTHDQPARASALVQKLMVEKLLGSHVQAKGIRPAVASLEDVLQRVFDQEAAAGRNLASVLQDDGMIAVRYRKPTVGPPSTKISNHAWGTAIDFRILGHDPPGNTHSLVPRFIAVLLPFFNAAGWYSGIGFSDSMHFEVADGTIHKWAAEGAFKA